MQIFCEVHNRVENFFESRTKNKGIYKSKYGCIRDLRWDIDYNRAKDERFSIQDLLAKGFKKEDLTIELIDIRIFITKIKQK